MHILSDAIEGEARDVGKVMASLNHRCQVVSGVLHDECSGVLSQFFQKQRTLGKK